MESNTLKTWTKAEYQQEINQLHHEMKNMIAKFRQEN